MKIFVVVPEESFPLQVKLTGTPVIALNENARLGISASVISVRFKPTLPKQVARVVACTDPLTSTAIS